MIYLDTDFLINYLIEQDPDKSKIAIQKFEQAFKNESVFCSLLCLQETAFVLAKLKIPSDAIEEMVDGLLTDGTVNYSVDHYRRAIELANKIGFQNINDCLHTAIAEEYCSELYTFNKADFKRIQRYTGLKISIL